MKFLIVVLSLLTCSTTFGGAAGVTGMIDASPYRSLTHDSCANSLALLLTESGGPNSTVTVCTFTIFDARGVKKADNIPFANGIGAENVTVACFEKTRAVVLVQTAAADIYYSVTVTTKGVTGLGSRANTDCRFRFVAGKNVVSYLSSSDAAQLFDAKLQPLGSPATVLGSPSVLNLGKYFRCTDGSRTQIWKVDSKGFTKLIDEAGEYVEINESKRMCCIEDGDSHWLCKY